MDVGTIQELLDGAERAAASKILINTTKPADISGIKNQELKKVLGYLCVSHPSIPLT